MDDIINETKVKVAALKVPKRMAIYVYGQNMKALRQLNRYGELVFSSQKSNYSLLYVDEAEVDEVIEKIQTLKNIKKIRKSHISEMNQDFSEAFAKTNAEVRQEMKIDLQEDDDDEDEDEA